jgi:undecaprenyl diphosphate synthase
VTTEIDRAIASLVRRPGLPRHIAVIMDGNGRWARQRGLPRIAGHKAGRESVRVTVRTCARLGIPYLSLYTFSLENWQRPSREVQALMRFLRTVLKSEYLELRENNIRLRAIGRLDLLPPGTRKTLESTMEALSTNTGMVLNLCISYGSRTEIADAARSAAREAAAGRLDPASIDEESFASFLYDPDLPDPDLLIRTSGEMRISNFMLWQIAYTEIVVTDVLWPDFREQHLLSAVEEYLGRERRFGGIRKGAVRGKARGR